MKNVLFLAALISVLLSSPCFSQGSPPSGFSGTLATGLIFIDNGGNLSPSGSKKSISTLDSAAPRQLSTIPILLPELSYRFGGNSKFSWYFNTYAPLEEAGDFALSTGVGYEYPDCAFFRIGVFYIPFAEVWENPYLLNQARTETDVSSWGAHLAIDRILNSKLAVSFAVLSEDVDHDNLATLFPDLARDGEVYDLSLGYKLFSDSAFPIRPKLSLRTGEYDGASTSYVKVKTEISGTYVAGRYTFVPSIYYSYKEHDEKDPVFGSTRSENGFGVDLAVTYDGLFGIESMGLLGIVGYSRGEANLTFYDTESLVCGLGLTYDF